MFFCVVIVVMFYIVNFVVVVRIRCKVVENIIVNFVSIWFSYCVDVICSEIIVFNVKWSKFNGYLLDSVVRERYMFGWEVVVVKIEVVIYVNII